MFEERLISTEKDLRPYFKSLVEDAVFSRRLAVTDISQFYLVNMLNDFSKTEHLFEWCEDHFEEPPLALLLSRALESDPSTRIKIFKKLGDISLYIAGYFSDYIDLKQVDIDYYISMGEGAYQSLSGIFAGEKTFYELYDELSLKFVELVDVLAEVRGRGGIASNTELVKLYERWLKTGDPRIRERLEKEGIDPQKTIPDGNNH